MQHLKVAPSSAQEGNVATIRYLFLTYVYSWGTSSIFTKHLIGILLRDKLVVVLLLVYS